MTDSTTTPPAAQELPHRDAPVVVGVDGTPAGAEVVRSAAREASLRGVRLHVVHTWTWPYAQAPLGALPVLPPEGDLRRLAERLVAEAVSGARVEAPGVEVTGGVVSGEAPLVLAEQSRGASLVVVGTRGHGGLAGLLVGSTAVHLASHAACPVLVVRGRPDAQGPVVVGVDGSPAGEAALGFAFAEASLRGADVVAVHTWDNWTGPQRTAPGETVPLVYDPRMLRDEEERVLAEAVAGWQEKHPEVTIHRHLVQERPRPALIEASSGAQLMVVGSRGRGGFTGLLLGSVSQAVLHHAHCPVAVVPYRHGRN